MITLALARDVDRLFRARRDNLAHPVGGPPGGAADRLQWHPSNEEARADKAWIQVEHFERGAVEQPAPDPNAMRVLAEFRDPENGCTLRAQVGGVLHTIDPRNVVFRVSLPSKLRTRRHVAMLALVERDHFDRCVAAMDEAAEDGERALLALMDDALRRRPPLSKVARQMRLPERVARHLLTERACGRLDDLPPAPGPSDADVLRTYAYLEDLAARVERWREADVVARANFAERAEAERMAAIDARTEAAMADDGDALSALAAGVLLQSGSKIRNSLPLCNITAARPRQPRMLL